jgi:hypothetical protein
MVVATKKEEERGKINNGTCSWAAEGRLSACLAVGAVRLF